MTCYRGFERWGRGNDFCPRRENEFLFLPGVSCREEVGFVMGQFIEQDGSTSFVKGQVIASDGFTGF